MSKPTKPEYLWSRSEDTESITEGAHRGGTRGTFGNPRGKVVTSGAHHVAIVVRSLKRSIEFYEGALGMKLRAIYPMHGVDAKHAFLDAGNGMEISFVEFAQPRAGVPGVSFPERNSTDSPITTLHHFAYRAESLGQLYAIREQVKTMGVKVSKVIDHHFISSFYFSDPDGFHLEVTTTTRPYTREEFQPDLLDRPLRAGESAWDESDAIERAEQTRLKLGIEAGGNPSAAGGAGAARKANL